MDELGLRALHFVSVVVPFVFFMASVYLVLHIVFARVIANPYSPVLWFFSVVTGPLTRPARALLPPSSPERRLRLVSLGVYVALWMLTRAVLAGLVGGAGR